MHTLLSRPGRWPLALMLTAVIACSDDPSSPARTRMPSPNETTLADPFTVTNLNDAGIGSLRWVLAYTTGGETIRFDPALAGQTIALDSSLKIRNPVTIEAPAGQGIAVSGSDKTRIINVYADNGTITLRNVSLVAGNAGDYVGAAINSSSDDVTIVLEQSGVYGAKGGLGNAIFGGMITLVNSTVDGTVNLLCPSKYGAVMGCNVVAINSTITNNGSAAVGSFNGTIILRNSILAGNVAPNCYAPTGVTIAYEGANISDDDGCGGPTEIIIADPKLAPLADNGGPTKTRALMTGSPAINAGSSCSVSVDQRYVPRDSVCDLGAYEFTDPTTVTLTIDPGAAVNQANGWAVVTGTVKCSRPESFSIAVQLAQQQKSGRSVSTVDAAAIVPVDCTTTARPWIASMVLTSGSFESGSGDAVAQTVYTEPWVSSASASARVKMYWARRTN